MSENDPTLISETPLEEETSASVEDEYLQETDESWQPSAQGEIPKTLARLLGLPRVEGYENYRLQDRRIESGLVIEDFSFESEPTEEVTALLAKPEYASEPLPAILCLHGMNQGRKTVMGETYYYDSRLNWLRGWGRELAHHGFLTAGLTQRTFGKRMGRLEEQSKVELLYGRTMMGAFVWEALRTLDLLARRDDVDENRLGIIGYGLGGTVGFYAAALDNRVKSLVTICGGIGSLDLFARWSDPNYHDVSYFIPGILDHFDHPEIVASLAPRAYLLMTREADPSMPVEGVRRVEWEGGASYMDLAVKDRLQITVRPGSHDFTTEDVTEAVEWSTRWLSEESARAFTVADADASVLED